MGVLGGLGSALALAAVAVRRGGTAVQPMNATSHWLHGPGAARRGNADAGRTLTGYATHQAASAFWASCFELWLRRRRPRGAVLLGDAVAMATVAAGVDYILTPERFTPGWELVLDPGEMAAGYLAMGLGMAAGAAVVPAR